MHKREKRNYQLLTTKGEIPEERQAENEAAQKAYDKLLTSVSTLAVSGEGEGVDVVKGEGARVGGGGGGKCGEGESVMKERV